MREAIKALKAICEGLMLWCAIILAGYLILFHRGAK